MPTMDPDPGFMLPIEFTNEDLRRAYEEVRRRLANLEREHGVTLVPDSDSYARGWHDGHLRGIEHAASEAHIALSGKQTMISVEYPGAADWIRAKILQLKEKHGGQPR